MSAASNAVLLSHYTTHRICDEQLLWKFGKLRMTQYATIRGMAGRLYGNCIMQQAAAAAAMMAAVIPPCSHHNQAAMALLGLSTFLTVASFAAAVCAGRHRPQSQC